MPSHTEEERRKRGALDIAGAGKLDMPSRPVTVAPGPVPGKGKYDYPTGMRPGEEILSSAAPLSSGKMGFPEHMRLKPGAELTPGKMDFPVGMEPVVATGVPARLPTGGEAIDIAKAPVGEWYGEGGFRGLDLPGEQGFMAVTGFDPKSTPFKDISARSAEERRVLAETRFAAGEKAPSMQRAALDSVFPARRQAISSPYEKSIKQLLSRFQKRDFINARERKDVGAVLNALIAQEGAYRRSEMGLPVKEYAAQTGRMTAESAARKREQDLTKLPEQLIPVEIGGETYQIKESEAHKYMKKPSEKKVPKKAKSRYDAFRKEQEKVEAEKYSFSDKSPAALKAYQDGMKEIEAQMLTLEGVEEEPERGPKKLTDTGKESWKDFR